MPSLKPAFLNRVDRVSPERISSACQSIAGLPRLGRRVFSALAVSAVEGVTAVVRFEFTLVEILDAWVAFACVPGTGDAGTAEGVATTVAAVPDSRSSAIDMRLASTSALGLISTAVTTTTVAAAAIVMWVLGNVLNTYFTRLSRHFGSLCRCIKSGFNSLADRLPHKNHRQQTSTLQLRCLLHGFIGARLL